MGTQGQGELGVLDRLKREHGDTTEARLRHALTEWFVIKRQEAEGQLPTADVVQVAMVAVQSLWLSCPSAEAVYRDHARRFHSNTGCCPHCGERGAIHEETRAATAA